ncbi:MgtC/SapB family protein [Robiginitalea sp. SC105]|uniref:MgtC/SapB family protein n=1 Tax=Robiginitalea sp. SC105 TaxID=2762332 RepID=UPI00163A840D|nr:MgtC/SapB family protein [Robiginitalea sp. SC105]MBC2838924.1 MgtC/SapB family protein [Robiginitalea sp. SC105]
MEYQDLINLGIAFGLGLLTGLQRQHADSQMAGVRTFTLISMFGVLAGILSREYDNPFIMPVFGLVLGGLLVSANFIKNSKTQQADIGQTTEVAALLMFAIGAYLVMGDRMIAVVTGGVVAILLYLKEKLHYFIERLEAKDLSAIMTFAGISLVILPLLPNKTFGPLDVLNLRSIWLMVTLIVGISVVGYFIYKYLGPKAGTLSGGVLGGLISSTATTVSYARKTAEGGAIHKTAAFVIVAASAVALVRVMVEVGVVIPQHLPRIILPLTAELLVLVALCVWMYLRISRDQSLDAIPEPKNPAQFKSALVFGLLYGLILLAVAFIKQEYGNEALYGLAVVSGLTDVDAITLSLSQLMRQDRLDISTGWKLILLASLSNLAFKGAMAAVLGTRKLGRWIGACFGLSLVIGLFIIWLWPENWHL